MLSPFVQRSKSRTIWANRRSVTSLLCASTNVLCCFEAMTRYFLFRATELARFSKQTPTTANPIFVFLSISSPLSYSYYSLCKICELFVQKSPPGNFWLLKRLKHPKIRFPASCAVLSHLPPFLDPLY